WAACSTVARSAAGVRATTVGVPPTDTALPIVLDWPSRNVSASAVCTCVLTVCAGSVPSNEIPAVAPPSRQVLLIPDAMPLRHGGTTATAVAASVGLMSPMPRPERHRPGRITVHEEFVL